MQNGHSDFLVAQCGVSPVDPERGGGGIMFRKMIVPGCGSSLALWVCWHCHFPKHEKSGCIICG